jgi:hypothetical protein
MLPVPSSRLRALLLALGLVALPCLVTGPLLVVPALAQDDDDDGGGGDDDDDGGSFGSSDDGSSDDTVWQSTPVVRPRAQAAPPPPLLDQAPDQIVVRTADVAVREALLSQDFTVLAETDVRVLLALPDEMTVPEALALVRTTAPGVIAAPNSYYRTQSVPDSCSGDLCQPWEAVGWPPVSVDPFCRFEPFIGVVDTGINIEHDMLSRAKVTLESIGSYGAEPSDQKHGTAVVALFVGDADSRVPGLVPGANLLVIDPFGRVGADQRSDVFSLATALDRLGSEGVSVASLSLAGPENDILRDAIESLQDQGIPVVAAVGNSGPRAEPLYPAAYPGVVAVTAVDGRDRIYRRAVQGDHVSFAGPGVAISTAASISGVRPQTGTSFAVPFVTTALAAAMADGSIADAAITRLTEASRDLGGPGKDDVFGGGLVQIPAPC